MPLVGGCLEAYQTIWVSRESISRGKPCGAHICHASACHLRDGTWLGCALLLTEILRLAQNQQLRRMAWQRTAHQLRQQNRVQQPQSMRRRRTLQRLHRAATESGASRRLSLSSCVTGKTQFMSQYALHTLGVIRQRK